MDKQDEQAARFRTLHESGVFVIPNVWDGASSAIMRGLGFKALATSSAACAASLGKLDGEVTREEALVHAGLIVSLSGLPVSADLENGFGHAPETVAETIRLAAGAGLVGGSIEDASGDARVPIYEFEHAVERVSAAVQVLPGKAPPPLAGGGVYFGANIGGHAPDYNFHYRQFACIRVGHRLVC